MRNASSSPQKAVEPQRTTGDKPSQPTARTYTVKMPMPSDLSDADIEKSCEIPDWFTASHKQEFFAAYRMRILNCMFADFLQKVPFGMKLEAAFAQYSEEQKKILHRAPQSLKEKRKAATLMTEDPEVASKRLKAASHAPAATAVNVTPADASKKTSLTPAFGSPLKQTTTLFQPATPGTTSGSTSPSKTTSTPKSNPFQGFGTPSKSVDPTTTTPKGAPTNGLLGPAGQLAAPSPFMPSTPSPAKSKRKADGDHPDDPNTVKNNKPTPTGSSTSNLMRSIVGSPEKSIKQLPKPAHEKQESTPSPFSGIFGKMNSAAAPPSTPAKASPAITETPTQRAPAAEEKENKEPAQSTTQAQNRTWNPETPIKFGQAPANHSSTAVAKPTASPFQFGDAPQSEPAKARFSFNTASTGPTPESTTSAPAPPVFSFLGASGTGTSTPKSLFGSTTANTSESGSGAQTPSQSDAYDSAATPVANEDDEGTPDTQLDLANTRAGEENETCLFDARAKATIYDASLVDAAGNGWKVKGVGPLRLLKHDQDHTLRLLVRADPGGKIVFNKNLIMTNDYAANGKTIKVVVLADDGKTPETWVFQVKTEESAKKLASCIQENKSGAA